MPRPLRVFLCHASQDKPAVRKLHRYLKQHGIEPWLDEIDLLPGENWEVEIPRALNASDVILVCLSKNSVNKEGYVQKEISFALDKALEKPDGTIFIIPAKLEDCEVPKRLNRYQWVDLFRPDSNKRLLLGLNKRALDLGSDVMPVILDDTRQRKITPKPLDQDVLEKAKRTALEKEEQEAAERVQRAKDELEAQEKIKREISENDAREKLKRETAEQAEMAKLAQIAKEKSDRETAEQAKVQLPVDRVSNPTIKWNEETSRFASPTYKDTYLIKPQKRQGIRKILIWIGGLFAFAILALVAWKMSQLPASPGVTQAPFTTQTIFVETPTKTPIPATSTTTMVLTPALGIGLTMAGKDGMTLVFVPAGDFIMGSNVSNHGDENPEQVVSLLAFWIDQTEVTNEEYAQCVSAGGCIKPLDIVNYQNTEYANHPVVFVSWHDANSYCSWAGRRLPTEAEWEKAARGPNGNIYPWSDAAPQDFLVNYNNHLGTTSDVNAHPYGVSAYRAADMAGNVWEWVGSLYQPYPYDETDGREDLSSSGQRVLRGGSWKDDTVRSAFRFRLDPKTTSSNIGFRCAISQP